jgi:hypothetical protein
VIALSEFKQHVLGPLLRGEQLTADFPITLFAAQLDHPLDYVLETDRWDEVYGSSRRLARAADKMQKVLTADGLTTDDLLLSDPSNIVALCNDPSTAKRWTEAIERAVAAETDLVTVSSVIHPLTTRQITGGLYRAPRSVIGVPGMSDYQERINRYYGLDSKSTVPRDEQVAQRRHFGEVVALLHGLLARSRETRQVVPFYEALPFAERCASCRIRPAERIDNPLDGPVCGVCHRKRKEPAPGKLDRAALLWIEAVGLDTLLEDQRSPAAYRHLCREVNDTLRTASRAKPGTTLLAAGNGWIVLVAPGTTALETASAVLDSISSHYGMKLLLPFIAAVALGTEPDQFRLLHRLMDQLIAKMHRTVEGPACWLDIACLNQPFDRFRKPFNPDDTRQLIAGVQILREAKLPTDAFGELPEQTARGNAGLYYTLERSKLSQAQQQALQRLERTWDAAPGPRFFSMLSAALSSF